MNFNSLLRNLADQLQIKRTNSVAEVKKPQLLEWGEKGLACLVGPYVLKRVSSTLHFDAPCSATSVLICFPLLRCGKQV